VTLQQLKANNRFFILREIIPHYVFARCTLYNHTQLFKILLLFFTKAKIEIAGEILLLFLDIARYEFAFNVYRSVLCLQADGNVGSVVLISSPLECECF
jgi:hypothetical protein